MTNQKLHQKLAEELIEAVKTNVGVPLISVRHPELTVEDAYAISLGVHNARLERGETEVGKKIGLTAKTIQEMMGIDEPDFGFLTDALRIPNGGSMPVGGNTIPAMMEAEIAFIMGSGLPAKNVTPQAVLEATEFVAPCLEVVETRFDTTKIKIVDTVADNASCSRFALGDERVDPRTVDLPSLQCVLKRNGEEISRGVGAAVLGSPLESVAWLANKLGSFGVTLNAGDIVLAGSLVPFAPIAAGDAFAAEFPELGSVELTFS